jgi:hypothetical protein
MTRIDPRSVRICLDGMCGSDQKHDTLGRDCPPDGYICLKSALKIEPVDVNCNDPTFGQFKIVTSERTYILQVQSAQAAIGWLAHWY